MKIESSYSNACGVPLGGIGTGSLEVRADGRLYDWHIFNNGPWAWRREDKRPEILSPNDFFMAVRTRTQGGSTLIRLLQAQSGYALGGDPYTLPWLKSVERVKYSGEPPFVFLEYLDADLPIEVSAEAFSPFIPGDSKSSSTPVAAFVLNLRNRTQERVEVSLAAGLRSPFSQIRSEWEVVSEDFSNGRLLMMRGLKVPERHCLYNGSVAIAAFGDGLDLSHTLVVPCEGVIPNWLELVAPPDQIPNLQELFLSSYESMRPIWVGFRAEGSLRDPSKTRATSMRAFSVLCCKRHLEPGEETRVVVVLSWFFPNHYDELGNLVGHMYENWYESAADVVKRFAEDFERLYGSTKEFHDLLYSTSIDDWILDLVASQLVILRKSTYYIKDSTFGVWEGYGCCGMNTTDVAFYGSVMLLQLFPDLEKNWVEYQARWKLTHEISPYYEAFALAIPENMMLFKEEVKVDPSIGLDLKKFKETVAKVVKSTGKDPTGRMPHFFVGSFKRPDTYDRPDMNPEYVLISIRDAVWLGDLGLLKGLWETLKQAEESVLRIHDEAGLRLIYHYTPSGYEAMGQGVASLYNWAPHQLRMFLASTSSGYTYMPISVQTFDAWSFIGLSSFTSLTWIASLRAMMRAAELVGDIEYKERASKTYGEARDNLEKLLWNGRYFDLWYDPLSGKRDNACAAAQLDGQMYVSLLLNMGYLIEREKVLSALSSIYRHNFSEDEGLINGVYPGRSRPALQGDMLLPNDTGIRYTVGSQVDTPWTGIEFEVAAHMIYEGMVEEGLRVLRAVYDRYAKYGLLWNHIECGSYYYRAMDSWLVLMALQGLFYNGFDRSLRFAPKLNRDKFKGLFTVTGAWGAVAQRVEGVRQELEVSLSQGQIELEGLELERLIPRAERAKVVKGNLEVDAALEERDGLLRVKLGERIVLRGQERLSVIIE
jgi:uncharacterized protein (DUF608 family)